MEYYEDIPTFVNEYTIHVYPMVSGILANSVMIKLTMHMYIILLRVQWIYKQSDCVMLVFHTLVSFMYGIPIVRGLGKHQRLRLDFCIFRKLEFMHI